MKPSRLPKLRGIALALLGFAGGAAAQERVDLPSPFPFEATMQRLEAGLRAAGMTIFTRIDHQAAANQVALAMPPTQVLVYGNPRGGTPLMLQHPALALDLPLRVLVREDGEHRVWVSYHPAKDWAARQGLSAKQVQALGKGEAVIGQALSARP